MVHVFPWNVWTLMHTGQERIKSGVAGSSGSWSGSEWWAKGVFSKDFSVTTLLKTALLEDSQ